MTWLTSTLPQIRNYIGDYAATSYSDARLTNIAITAAHSLLNEVSFDNNYTVDVPNSSIAPDPSTSPADTNFINLLSLKSALLIVNSEARTKSIQVFNIKDGPSSIDTGGAAKSLVELSKILTDTYCKAKLDYIAGNSAGALCIMGPVYTNSQTSIFG